MSSPYPEGELLAELCLNKFDTLPKTGKPTSKEWTIQAGVVQYDENHKESKVVALGAGTKCIGRSKLCSGGLILNDSHAEVLARRALLRYFYAELKKAIEYESDNKSIFQWNAEKLFFTLKRELSFHFISTQTPCGDACIVDESCDEESIETPHKKPKLVCDELVQKDVGKTLSNDSEVVYTGAKLIGEHSDLLQQFVGVVRTKPGRGDRTLSMSCSDKLSKWNVLGVQGALLDSLLEKPIYFDTLTFCCSRSNEKSIRRALYGRWLHRQFEHVKYKPQKPLIHICDHIKFKYVEDTGKQPSPNGLVWCDIPINVNPIEISVNGKRQGVTAKKSNSPQAALRISKYHLLLEYVQLLKAKPELCKKFGITMEELKILKYNEFKNIAEEYQNAWEKLKSDYFQQWTSKPQYLQTFSIVTQKTDKTNL